MTKTNGWIGFVPDEEARRTKMWASLIVRENIRVERWREDKCLDEFGWSATTEIEWCGGSGGIRV
jgi:hypothetical protein